MWGDGSHAYRRFPERYKDREDEIKLFFKVYCICAFRAWYLRYFLFDDTSKGMLGFTLVTVIYAMSLQGRSFREKIRT